MGSFEEKNYIPEDLYSLVAASSAQLVANPDRFECPICLETFDIGHGVILKECLHSFCRPCLCATVESTTEANVPCPYMDKEGSCELHIQQTEVKCLLGKDRFEKYLERSLNRAEHTIKGTFHCKVPNCTGWWLYDQDVSSLPCPVCNVVNCLICAAVHTELTCQEYQSVCDGKADSRSVENIEALVAAGQAKYCPYCGIAVFKTGGCDYIMCSLCKNGMCWVTGKPRFGPAGCNCSNVKKCHPMCQNCH